MAVDWEGILEREGPSVWRTVYRLLGHHADAEECFQETFLSAVELWRRQSVRHPRAVLLRLATARAVDRLRQRYRDPVTPLADNDAPASDPRSGPAETASAAELAEAMRAALADLPERQADVFCLVCLDGSSYRDVADALGLSTDAVGVLLHRARARLREALASRAPPLREVTR